MRTRVPVLVLSAVVASCIGMFAQAPPVSRTGGLGSTDQSEPTQNSTTLRMPGTIDKYDASTRMLSLSTASGTVHFQIASTVRIRQGWHRINAPELAKMSGYRVAVRYSEADGNKTVESVHVFGKSQETKQ
jgi:hypothetical protein